MNTCTNCEDQGIVKLGEDYYCADCYSELDGVCLECGELLTAMYENNGFQAPDPTHVEFTGYKQCECGFIEEDKEVGIKLGYQRISKTRTKFFFEKNAQEVEFYIDRDIKTSTATLWLRPGVLTGGKDFISALMAEWARAKREEKL